MHSNNNKISSKTKYPGSKSLRNLIRIKNNRKSTSNNILHFKNLFITFILITTITFNQRKINKPLYKDCSQKIAKSVLSSGESFKQLECCHMYNLSNLASIFFQILRKSNNNYDIYLQKTHNKQMHSSQGNRSKLNTIEISHFNKGNSKFETKMNEIKILIKKHSPDIFFNCRGKSTY